jgi:long-chain acyl-CoA synthetase
MNIAQHVERAATFFPDHPAIIFEGVTLSYRELNVRASRLANALKAHGVRRGDRVALYLPNIPSFAVSYVAALKAGAVAVSINSIFKSEEVKYILNDSGSSVLFTVGDLLQNIPRMDCPQLQHLCA